MSKLICLPYFVIQLSSQVRQSRLQLNSILKQWDHTEAMRSVCGLMRLSQENESSATAFYPIRVPHQSKFSDRTTETRRYGPDIPMQSYLENRPLTISTPHSFPTHIIVKSVLMGLTLTRPPTAQPRHSTCLRGAPWTVGKPTGPPSNG